MSKQQTNKDLPASPIMFKNQFGQDVILAGFTKQEKVALNVLNAQLSILQLSEISIDDIKQLIESSYIISEKFCEYLEKQNDNTTTLNLV